MTYNAYMLVDEVKVTFIAGKGGDGKTSFLPGYKVLPNGGDGGRGGSIYVITSSDMTLLTQFGGKNKVTAQDGNKGELHRKDGKVGHDTIITLPVGCVLKEVNTGETIELNNLNEKMLLAKGGEGGRGTWAIRTTNFREKFPAEEGKLGEKKEYLITLKLIADYGLVGLPNAGKSSLLNTLTNAKARVANYPFTTLEPNLGVMEHKVIVDIPGLIEGASQGKGLGIKSLKHIEKVKLIIHCISSESENPRHDYEVIRNELNIFNNKLTNKPEIILLTKLDLVSEENLKKKKKILEAFGRVYMISVYQKESIEEIKKIILKNNII